MKNEASDPVVQPSRRDFLRLGAATALGVGITQLTAETAAADEPAASKAATMIDVPFTAVTPRIGIIGTGGRGTSLLENLLAADAKVLAICDVVREKAEHAQALVVKAGQASPSFTPTASTTLKRWWPGTTSTWSSSLLPGTGTWIWPSQP